MRYQIAERPSTAANHTAASIVPLGFSASCKVDRVTIAFTLPRVDELEYAIGKIGEFLAGYRA